MMQMDIECTSQNLLVLYSIKTKFLSAGKNENGKSADKCILQDYFAKGEGMETNKSQESHNEAVINTPRHIKNLKISIYASR